MAAKRGGARKAAGANGSGKPTAARRNGAGKPTATRRRRTAKPMTCKDAISLLAEFIETELSPDALAELEAHLRGCEPCRAYFNTYRRTRGLVGKAATGEMPEEMKARLREFLLGQLGGGERSPAS